MSSEFASDTYSPAEQQPDRLDGPLVTMTLTLLLGAVLALINTTVVGVALPQIGSRLDTGLTALTWVGTAYVLALGVAIALSGWAVVSFGLRPTWLVALAVFALGSLGAALAPHVGWLIAARAVQGLGGGMLEPVMLTAVARAAGPSRMGRAMGLVAGVIGVGPLVGPVLGGVVVQILDFRWMFGLFALLAVGAFVVSSRLLPDSERAPRRLDVPGLVLLALGASATLWGLSGGTAPSGADAAHVVGIVAGLLVVAAYVGWARRRGPDALVDLAPVRSTGFLPAATIMLLLGAAIYPMFFGLPQFYQGTLGVGALAAGLLLVPQGLGALAGMSYGGRLSDRVSPRRLVVAGSLTAAVGNLGFVLLGTDAPVPAYLATLLLSGLGVGFVGGPTVSSLYRVLPAEDTPAGTTILFILNQLGGALGIAVMATLIGSGATGEAAWTASDGTVPMLLPVAGALAILALSRRLPARPAG